MSNKYVIVSFSATVGLNTLFFYLCWTNFKYYNMTNASSYIHKCLNYLIRIDTFPIKFSNYLIFVKSTLMTIHHVEAGSIKNVLDICVYRYKQFVLDKRIYMWAHYLICLKIKVSIVY